MSLFVPETETDRVIVPQPIIQLCDSPIYNDTEQPIKISEADIKETSRADSSQFQQRTSVMREGSAYHLLESQTTLAEPSKEMTVQNNIELEQQEIKVGGGELLEEGVYLDESMTLEHFEEHYPQRIELVIVKELISEQIDQYARQIQDQVKSKN